MSAEDHDRTLLWKGSGRGGIRPPRTLIWYWVPVSLHALERAVRSALVKLFRGSQTPIRLESRTPRKVWTWMEDSFWKCGGLKPLLGVWTQLVRGVGPESRADPNRGSDLPLSAIAKGGSPGLGFPKVENGIGVKWTMIWNLWGSGSLRAVSLLRTRASSNAGRPILSPE